MNASRPWLNRLHGVGFETDDEKTGGTGGAAQGSGGGDAPRLTLAQILEQHPHVKDELAGEVQRVGSREKEQGKRSGLNDFLQQHGLDGIPDPSVIVEGYRKFTEQQASQMTEAERLRADAERDRQAAAADRVKAKQEKFDASAIKWLTNAGADDPELLAAALTRLGVDLDSDEEAIKAAVGELKKRSPGSFAGKPKGTPGTGNPGAPPAGSPGGTGDGKSAPGQQASQQRERIYGKKKQPA
jgi:HPt (histidine-containing phosphotransfer) domain-containing protein